MNDIFETLKKLSDNQRKKESKVAKTATFSVENSKRKDPSYIYLDEQDNQIKEIPLSKLDSAGSALINKVMKKKQNPAQLIHDSIFG